MDVGRGDVGYGAGRGSGREVDPGSRYPDQKTGSLRDGGRDPVDPAVAVAGPLPDAVTHARNAAAMWTALAAGGGEVLLANDALRVVLPSRDHALRALVLRPDVDPEVVRDAVLPRTDCPRRIVENVTGELDLDDWGFTVRFRMTVMTWRAGQFPTRPAQQPGPALGVPRPGQGFLRRRQQGDRAAGRDRSRGVVTVSLVTSAVELVAAEAIMVQIFPPAWADEDTLARGPAAWWHGRAQPLRVLGIPGWCVWLVRLDGEPVGAAYTFDDGTSVGVYQVATLPGHRRRGVATAVMSAILARYPDRIVNLTASDDGRPVYERTGFRVVNETAWWTPSRGDPRP